MTFALGTFSGADGVRFVGIVRDERVVRFDGAESVLASLQDWESGLAAVRRAAADASFDDGVPMNELQVHPPVDLPRQLFFTGANYRKHVVDLTIDQGVGPPGLEGDELRRWAEQMMDERAANGVPYSFLKAPSSIIGAFDDIVLPPTTKKPDWELELGVIIGRGGRNIARSDAMSHVAGYAIVNDVSARDLIGPLLVLAEFVADPHDLRLLLTLNGQPMQDESTADMLFDIARQIEYVSTYAELWPGDLISTGSPAGNGTHYGRFLSNGDMVEATITGLGTQRNRCVAAK
jgi:2,4-didehydro-3-deoxy-L-rhamnonate hydrolase